MARFRSFVASFRSDPYAHGMLMMLPAIQFGLNYFVSVASLLFLVMIWRTRLRVVLMPTAVVVVASAMSLLWCIAFQQDAPNFPRELRFTAGMIVLFWALSGARRETHRHFDPRWALGLLIALGGLAALQWLAGKRGIALYVPQSFFVNSSDWSLASSWVEHAREHGYEWSVRPSAVFSEPSYLGGVSLALHFICLHTMSGRARKAATIVAIATCLIAQTYYGLVCNLLIAAVFYRFRVPKPVILMSGLLALCLVALPLFAAEPGRLERILTGDDVSTSIRLFQPLQILGYVMTQAPFGVPITAATSIFEHAGLIQPFEDAPLQNGLIDLIMSYGWLGLPMLALLWRVAGGGLSALFVFLLMGQNGAPLDFDKIVMIVLAIHLVRQARGAQHAAASRHERTPAYLPLRETRGN